MRHLAIVKAVHERDVLTNQANVWLPHALARKYPLAAVEWGWQYAFLASRQSTDLVSGERRRHHIGERARVKKSGINKPVGCHTFRHSQRRTHHTDLRAPNWPRCGWCQKPVAEPV